MSLDTPKDWQALRQVDVDLTDALGSSAPGITQSRKYAKEAFGSQARIFGSLDAPFLLGRMPVAIRPDQGQQAAFAGSASAFATSWPDSSSKSTALRPVTTLRSRTGSHVVVQQQIRGHDVVGGRFCGHNDADGAYALSGSPVGDLGNRDPGPPPSVPLAEVRSAIRAAFAVRQGQRLQPELVVFPVAGDAVWAWRTAVTLESPSVDMRVFLDGTDLSHMLSYPISVPALVGEGSVFPVSPSRTPGLSPVALFELGPDPSNEIGGSWFSVRDGRGGTPLQRTTRDFRLSQDHNSFDVVAAYYHLMQARRYFGGLFHSDVFQADVFKPLKVVVRDPNSPDNAFFHPDRHELTFGDFGGGARPSARSADMVLHEFGHAVTYSVCRLSSTPSQQAKALGEGYSDYFASSALDDPRFGDYVLNSPQGGRNCAEPGLSANGDLDRWEEHKLGAVWAAVLWALRVELGASLSDTLAAESVYYVNGAHTLTGARAALLVADATLFPGDGGRGRHASAIESAFDDRIS